MQNSSFQETHALLRAGDAKSASLAYIQVLKSPQAFLSFLQIKDLESMRARQLDTGAAITDVVELANLRPAEFRQLFEFLFNQYAAVLKKHQDLPPLELWAALTLFAFLGGLTNRSEPTFVLQISDFYFEQYAELPEIYLEILAEHALLLYIQSKNYERAWTLEKHAQMLKKLMERDGKDLLALVSILANLHILQKDPIEAELEILRLRFGEPELHEALERSRLQ